MKKLFFPAMCLVAALSFLTTSCQKETAMVDLMATIEDINSNGKMYVDGSHLRWNDADEVRINGETKSVTVASNKAKISGVTSASNYYAIYPASIASSITVGASSNEVILPSKQVYQEVSGVQKVSMPMCGTKSGSEDGQLQFHNLGALVKVTVTNNTGSAFTLDSIEISSASVKLSGKGTVNMSSYELTMSNDANSYGYVRLTGINTSINNGSNKTYYIVVPPFAGKIDVMIYTSNGNMVRNSSATTPTLVRNDVGQLAMAPTTLQIGKGTTCGHDWVQLYAGGPKWATCNLGATTATDYGYFFSWGSVEGKNLNGTGSYLFPSTDYTISLTGNIPANATYDAACKSLGAPWRMPTKAEFSGLGNGSWTTNGRSFTGTTTGYTSNSIFLPAAGWYGEGDYRASGERGFYRSSTIAPTADCAYDLYFTNASLEANDQSARWYGFSVRAVCD